MTEQPGPVADVNSDNIADEQHPRFLDPENDLQGEEDDTDEFENEEDNR